MVEKDRKKAWHDMYIKTKSFVEDDQVMLYDIKYTKHPRKLQMHWIGPFIVADIHEFSVFKIVQLDMILLPGWVNNACMEPYISI
jgi:hypothetical protein